MMKGKKFQENKFDKGDGTKMRKKVGGKAMGKRLLAAGLAAVMVLGLTSCGGEKNPNGELAKQYVFSSQEIPMPEMEGDDHNIQSVSYVNDRVYVVESIYYYPEVDDSVGGEGVAVPLAEAPESETEEPEDGNEDADGEENTDDEENADGEEGTDAEEPVADEPVVVDEVTVKTLVVSFKLDGSDVQSYEIDAPSGSSYGDGYNAYTNYNQVTVGADGCIYGIKDSYESDWRDPENSVDKETYELVKWGQDGKVQWSFPVFVRDSANTEDYSWYYVSGMKVQPDGTVCVVLQGDTLRIVKVDAQGNQLGQQDLDTSQITNIQNAFIMADGTVGVTNYNEDWTAISYRELNPDTGSMTEPVELSGVATNGEWMEGPGGALMVVNASGGIFKCDPAAGTSEQIMSYVNSDLNTNYLNNISFIDEDRFIASYGTTVDDEYRQLLCLFTRVNPEDIPDKIVLTFGCSYLSSLWRNRIVDFNKSNERYRIVVKDYSQTVDDYDEQNTQLNNDIIGGNMPDILVADSQLPIDNYIAKGLLADIGKLIEEDEELSQVEYMQNVFDAYSVDGVLYYVVPSFSVITMVGKTSIIGDRTGWTMEEFMDLLNSRPEGTSGFGQDMTQGTFMYYLMEFAGTDYVDAATGKCSFDSPEFISMLEYAKTLPAEYDYGDDYDWEALNNQYLEDRTLVTTMGISDFASLKQQMAYTWGIDTDLTYVGFPCADRNGNTVSCYNSLVLSASSPSMEGAWEFARYYLTEDYQSKGYSGLPTIKSLLMEMSQEALRRPHYTNEDGTETEYDNTIYLNGEEVIIPPMTQAELDEVLQVVESANKKDYYNNDIRNIIDEEAAPFFAGQKSAEEVAKIIQSKVELMVNESR